MTVTTLSFREVIDQLVRQQFFIEPNIITDRTYSLQFEVEGSEQILNYFANFLFDHSKDLFGTDPSQYLAVLNRTGKKLSINPLDKLKTRFNEKIGSFIEGGRGTETESETETILFIATISSILEVLDHCHYQTLLKELSSLYYHQCVSNSTTQEYDDQAKNLDDGIKRLSEAAEPKLSLIQNVIKLKSLASIFDITDLISYDKRQLMDIQSDIIRKVITGSY
ncbi:hypothetical protein CEE45_09630 [Candidatus Heimdallarchaeota archaeon B3_Heim]|nr:MAG: hypothetical protein CEE45_09630 [Candidatus Heimdallarchaeota archaeon B3_Heim]